MKVDVAGVHTTKPRTQPYVDAFVKGAGGEKIYQYKDIRNKLPNEELVLYGILAGSGEIYKKCIKENKNFYYMDHSYFANCHNSPYWFRITKNKHCQNKLIDVPSDRYEKFFAREIKSWNKTGEDILVLPPTNAICDFFNVEDWLKQTLQTLKSNTDRKIRIREKPYNPIVAKDHIGATVKIDKATNHQEDIIWSEYFAVVTYNSNTVIKSLTNGVPVFCDSQLSAAAPISETDFSKIETPKYGDRFRLFSSLSYNTWNLQELKNGTAWRMLNEM
jgi:hypothetical protein